jgi:alkaline phosphatase
MVQRAIQMLQLNARGYLLIVNAELIRRAAEQNDAEHAISETIEMDRALAAAINSAGAEALIIATGGHSAGGMILNGYPLRQDHGVALLGKNAFGYPSITWASGPNGEPPTPILPAAAGQPSSTPAAIPNQAALDAPAAFYAPSAINTATDVLAVGIGPGSENLRGFLDNTAIFQILKSGL